jgi:oxygen-independent coproporphyrinogen-3 oxidase
MGDRRLDYAVLSKQIGVDFATTYARELDSLTDLEADGLLVRDGKHLEVTRVGAPLLRVIAMRFDTTLSAGPRRHAQTV